jgi:hypothetical protein
MGRTAFVFALLLFVSAPVQPAPQNLAGTYSANNAGTVLTLKLEQDAAGRVTGELSSSTGARFALEGMVTDKGSAIGTARGPQGTGLFLAEPAGAALTLTVAEQLPNGQPNMARAQRVQMQRSEGGALAESARGQQPAGTPSAQDQQISQLLLASAWCSFSYSGVAGTSSGRSSTERVVFRADGNGLLRSGGESYSSNRYGSVAGQSAGGQAFRWQVRGGMLNLSFDGGPWSPTPLQVTPNSNGYPIIKASGKEYTMCN